jgi:hypothetical protein
VALDIERKIDYSGGGNSPIQLIQLGYKLARMSILVPAVGQLHV